MRKQPSYRLHKPSGQAIVVLSGRMIYLGPHGSKASHKLYDAKIAEWLQGGRKLVTAPTNGTSITVAELCAAYLEFALAYYRKAGRPSGEHGPLLSVLSALKHLYAKLPVDQFKPLKLKALREHMVSKGWARSTINKQIKRVVRIFSWGVENELVDGSIPAALREVRGLEAGRTEVREASPVLPVADSIVDATIPHLSPVVAAMVRLQRLTGMRPGEVVLLRPCDLDRGADVWRYVPAEHKTEHFGRMRVVQIGPRAQKALEPFLDRDPKAYCFSPKEAVQEHRRRRTEARVTPAGYGNGVGDKKRKAKREAGGRYTSASYRVAIRRACEVAFKMPADLRAVTKKSPLALRNAAAAWREASCWCPNQLRHAAATDIRAMFGLEHAQVALGHATASVTQHYAERDQTKAAEVAAKIG